MLGDYEIILLAGGGGMGVVYKATQRTLGRPVALKLIRTEIAASPEYRERFLREARLAASVEHPHVVSVHDAGDIDGRLFLAMQWIDGHDLRALLDLSGPLAPERAVAITVQIADALAALHERAGMIHRDVKPANVLVQTLRGRDHAYLTDFGIAKPADALDHLTRTGLVVGTSGYLSPEQIRGADPDSRSDVYALGCLCYEAMTRQPPFRGENEMALRWAHANDPRPRVSESADVSSRYDEVLRTALAIDPDRRYRSVLEFATALEGAEEPWHRTEAPMAAPPHPETVIGPPTPQPPRTPIQPVTPAATVSPPPRSGSPLALVLIAIVAFAGIAVGALAAAGAFSHAKGKGQTASNPVTHKSRPSAPGSTSTKTRTVTVDHSVTTTTIKTTVVSTPQSSPGGAGPPSGGNGQVSGSVAQFGAFSSASDAQAEVQTLDARGLQAQVINSDDYVLDPALPPGTGHLYLVVSEPYSDISTARAAAASSGVAGAFARTVTPAR